VLFHFGIYPFIRGLHFGKDVIFDFQYSNPLVIALVFIHVLFTLIIITIFYRYLPKNLIEALKIKNLIGNLSLINKYALILLYVSLISFQIISYYKYGVMSYILPDAFARIGNQLPYWFTSIRTIYPLLTFMVCLGLISSMLRSPKYVKYAWLILMLVFLPVVILYGRRFFLAVMIIWVTLWLVETEKKLFSVRNILVVVSMGLVLVLASNIFQSYRRDFQRVGQFDVAKLKNPFSEAINFNATLKNLGIRPGTWEFNFLVFNRQFSSPDMFTKGKIATEGLKSSIPRIIWPEKQFLWIDHILAELYQVKPREIDIGKNLFGIGQVEIGYLSLIIVPLIILTILALMAALIKLTACYPTFLWLFIGNILFFLVNIEENGNEIFFMVRNIALILVIFGIYLSTQRILEFQIPRIKKLFNVLRAGVGTKI
jgi:hypothetical protein